MSKTEIESINRELEREGRMMQRQQLMRQLWRLQLAEAPEEANVKASKSGDQKLKEEIAGAA